MSWDIVKLDSIFDIARGGSPRPINDYLTDDIDGINWIMIGDTESGQKYINSTAKKIKKEGVSKSRAVHKGDFLLTNSMSFGRPYILNIDGCIHDGWLVLSPINENLSKDYFYFYLGSNEIKSRLASMAAGAVVKNLNKDLVKSLKIPFPPLEEQKKIAAILDAADAYRQKTKALIDKYDQLTQSLFQDMFGDPFIEDNDKNIVPFKELTNRITYGFTKPMKHLDSGIPILTAKNIRNGYIDYEKTHFADKDEFNVLTSKSKPEKFDILITKDGSIGRTAMLEADFPVCINQSVALVKPKKEIINPKYLVGYLVSVPVQRKIQNMGKGAGLKHLQITELAKFPTVLISLKEQNQFAERVAQIEKQKQQAEASLVKAEELFSSLLQRAFKGELTS